MFLVAVMPVISVAAIVMPVVSAVPLAVGARFRAVFLAGLVLVPLDDIGRCQAAAQQQGCGQCAQRGDEQEASYEATVGIGNHVGQLDRVDVQPGVCLSQRFASRSSGLPG